MNNILNKIAQMERNAEEIKLESHKVELSSIKEMNDAIKILKSNEADAEKVANLYEDKVNEARKQYQALVQERNAIYTWVNNEAPAILGDFEKKAKELGLDPNAVPEVKEFKKWIQSGKDIVKALDEYKDVSAFK